MKIRSLIPLAGLCLALAAFGVLSLSSGFPGAAGTAIAAETSHVMKDGEKMEGKMEDMKGHTESQMQEMKGQAEGVKQDMQKTGEQMKENVPLKKKDEGC